jgi:hypothetical protein
MLASGRPTIATAVRVVAGSRDRDGHDPHDKDCERVTTTGRATVRRRCDGTRAHASVDNRIAVSDPRAVRKTHERPVDRLRARGEGRIHATGDKGAQRELHEKAHRRR